jgi:hypothetical protein
MELTPKKEWMHRFIHTLETIPKNWYLELEMHRDTTDWDYMTQRFKVTFTFEHESPLVDVALQDIRHKIFSEEESMEVIYVCSAHNASMTVHQLLECYNVAQEAQDEEDPRNVQVPETEGERIVEGPELESTTYAQPLKTQKVNIGTEENPKFAQIGDYWSDETIEKLQIYCTNIKTYSQLHFQR